MKLATLTATALLLTGCATPAVYQPQPQPQSYSGLTPSECLSTHATVQGFSETLIDMLPACERNPGLTEACKQAAVMARMLEPAQRRAIRCIEAMMPPPNLSEAKATALELSRRLRFLADRTRMAQ